ncbi:MAG: hypothetical protein JF616_18875 [Fibrobacteres bacterium]|nr:hypothetical protein [Fibrobacterota bacterium]
MRGRGSQRGAALAYVLSLLAIMSILVGTVWRLIRADNALAARSRGEAQARLLAAAGLDYARSRIGPPGPGQDLGYATEGLEYRLDNAGRDFRLSVRSHGMFGRAVAIGVSPTPSPGRTSAKEALLGQTLDLARMPALGLLNHEGNMVLAGSAQVTGPVLLWRGDVRKATDYHVRWTGGPGHVGPTWDSIADAWKRAGMDFARADKWMEAQSRMLASGDFTSDGDYDSGKVADVRLGDSAILVDTAMARARITAGKLTIGSGARLKDCKLAAKSIEVRAGAELLRVIAFAQGNLRITGGTIRGGQFLAGDSIVLSTDRPLLGWPFFYARGRMSNRGRPDSAMAGAMLIEKAAGQGLFVSACREHPPYDQQERLVVAKGVRLSGFLFTPCYARMEGDLVGSLLCQNLRLNYAGTIWMGHLKDSRISQSRARIPAPLLFPGLEPAVFALGSL